MKPSLLRVGVLLALCAACFQSGRWYQELSGGPAHRSQAKADPGNELVTATAQTQAPAPKTIEPTPLASAGDPVGQPTDVITPLNVRDPSALVMGPGATDNPPTTCPIPPASPPARAFKPVKPLKSGRLLELLKKGEADKKSDAPKSF